MPWVRTGAKGDGERGEKGFGGGNGKWLRGRKKGRGEKMVEGEGVKMAKGSKRVFERQGKWVKGSDTDNSPVLTNRRKILQIVFMGQEIYLVSSKISFLALGQKIKI